MTHQRGKELDDRRARNASAGQKAPAPQGKLSRSSPQNQLLRLQRVAGNSAVAGLATRPQAAPLAVYRDPTDTGLKKEDAIGAFSGKVKERVTGARNPMGGKKEWATLSDGERANKLAKYANAELDKAHVPKVACTLDPDTRVGGAQFDFTTWTLSIGSKGGFAGLSDAQLADLGNTVYHESRHAEQWFRIARLKAGEDDPFGDGAKPSKSTLKTKLGIPQKVAAEAMDRPLKPLTKAQKFFHSKDWADRQGAKSTEGGSWYDSVYGAGSRHREDVYSDLRNRKADYRALAEEADAYYVGDKSETKLKALLADFRQKQAAKAAKAGTGATA
jgi:hypothetical protein